MRNRLDRNVVAPPKVAANRLPRLVRYSLYLFAFTIFFENWDLLTFGGARISKFTGLLFFVVCLVNHKRVLRYPSWTVVGLIGVVAIGVFSTAANIEGTETFNEFLVWPLFPLFQCVVLYWFVQDCLRDTKTALTLLFVLLFASLTVAALMRCGIGIGEASSNSEGIRYTFFGFNPNTVGFHLAIGIVLIMGIMFVNPLNFGIWRFLLLLGIPLLFSALVATGSRGAVACVAFGAIPLLFGRYSLLFRALSWTFFVVLCLGAMNFLLRDELMAKRLGQTMENGDTSGRAVLWTVALERTSEKPITGWGFSGMSRICYNENEAADPHNAFLAFFFSTGVFGGITFLICIARIGYSAFIVRNGELGVLPFAIFCVTLVVVSDSGGIYSFKMVWMLLALVLALATKPITQNNVKTWKDILERPKLSTCPMAVRIPKQSR